MVECAYCEKFIDKAKAYYNLGMYFCDHQCSLDLKWDEGMARRDDNE